MPVSVNDNGKRITSFDEKTVVFYSYSFNSSASAQSLASLMSSLSERGYKVHLVTYSAPAGDDFITAENVERHVLANLENDGMPSSVSILRVLGSIPAKTVVLWGSFTKRMYQCYLAAKSLGRAVVLYQTATPVLSVSSGSPSLSVMYANTVAGCDCVITPCDKDVEMFSGMGAVSCKNIPFYFPYDTDEVSASTVENREIAFFTNYSGHNVRNIITALAMIHEKYPDSSVHMIIMKSVKPSKATENLMEYVRSSGLGDSFIIEEKVLKPLRALRTAGISITYAHCEHFPQTVMESVTAGIPAINALDADYTGSSLPCECVNASDIQGIYKLLDRYMDLAEREKFREKARNNLSADFRGSITEMWISALNDTEERFEKRVSVSSEKTEKLASMLPDNCADTKAFFAGCLESGYSYGDIFGAMLFKGYNDNQITEGFMSSGLFAGNNPLTNRFMFKNVIKPLLNKGNSPEESILKTKKGLYNGFEIEAMLLFGKVDISEIISALGIPEKKYFLYALNESYYLLNCLYNSEVMPDPRIYNATGNSTVFNMTTAMKRFEGYNHKVLKFRNHHFVRRAVKFHNWSTSPWDFKSFIDKILCFPFFAKALLSRKLLLMGKKRQNKRKVAEIDPGDIRKIQLLVLMLLLEMDKICKKHNLTYYIAGGSILGAVRHKGFIPWDDDIDITMPRPDYDKFIKIAQKELPDEYYLDKDCVPFCHNRIEIRGTDFTTFWRKGGVFLDILALEGCPDDESKRLEHERKCKFWRSCMLEKARPFPLFDFSTSKKIKRYICCFILKFVPRWFIKKNWERWAKKYSTQDTQNWVCLPASIYTYEQETFPKEYWGKPVYLEFEGLQLPTMAHWEDYLICHFGDYMKMPPVTTRKSHHFIYSYSLGKYADMTTDEIEKLLNEKKKEYMP